jgi:hypothetical protein
LVMAVDDHQTTLMQVIYDQLRVRGTWPTYDQIDRLLRRARACSAHAVRSILLGPTVLRRIAHFLRYVL